MMARQAALLRYYRVLVIVLACAAPPWWIQPAAAEDAFQALAFTPRQGTVLPLDAPFTDTSGQTRPLGAFLGHGATIIAMGYYACPNMCELERTDLLDALARGGLKTPGDYTLLVVSIDPAETRFTAQQALAEDLARFPDAGAGQGWHFVTGTPASIRRLSRAVGFHARYDEKLHQYLHPMGLVFITPAGTVSGYVLGVGYQPGDVRQALAHAARGEQVRAAPILLLCFHYDETTGRYTLAVEKLLKLGGVLTVLMLGTLLGMAHWRGAAMNWLPEASAHASRVDILLAGLLLISLAVLGLVFGLMMLNIIRFRVGSRVPVSAETVAHKSWRFEIGWTATTLAVFFALFVWAARLYVLGFQPPPGAIQIYVTGKQWMWKIQYPGGQREINALHVPLGRPVQLLLTSEDVIHDFSIPVLRIKHDVLPGQYQSLWFIATQAGAFRFYCTQFCGIGHSRMTGTLIVLTPTDYANWLGRTPASGSLATKGEALFIHNGCSGCHVSQPYAPDADDTSRAPSMVGLYGSEITGADGQHIRVDNAFLHDAILHIGPARGQAAGYATRMPSYRGVLGEEDLAALIAYLQTLSPSRSSGMGVSAVSARKGN